MLILILVLLAAGAPGAYGQVVDAEPADPDQVLLQPGLFGTSLVWKGTVYPSNDPTVLAVLGRNEASAPLVRRFQGQNGLSSVLWSIGLWGFVVAPVSVLYAAGTQDTERAVALAVGNGVVVVTLASLLSAFLTHALAEESLRKAVWAYGNP